MCLGLIQIVREGLTFAGADVREGLTFAGADVRVGLTFAGVDVHAHVRVGERTDVREGLLYAGAEEVSERPSRSVLVLGGCNTLSNL